MSDTMRCYVCMAKITLSEPDDLGLIPEFRDNRVICMPCQKLACEIADAAGDWNSSEDSELWHENAALEGLRRGRAAAKAAVESVATDPYCRCSSALCMMNHQYV